MAEETKSPSPASPDGEKKPAAETPPSPPGVVAASETGKAAPVPPGGDREAESATPPAQKATPAAPAAPVKPTAAAPPAKPAAPAKPAGPTPMPWSSPMVEKYKRQYGSGLDAETYLGQNYFRIDNTLVSDFLRLLRDEEEFDYCVDVTAVHYPGREKQFDVIWILYSFRRNERIRVKTQIADGASLPSSFPIWPTANWLEREVYDMFGIKFEGHPDLKRILLPEGWKGFPLRKDYSILQQDQEWVQINLGIESGQ